MTKTFLVSDTHFGHANICRFLDKDGNKVRPWDEVDKMDKDMIEYWNAVVSDEDRVYHLGDVVINRRALSILYALKGRKKLIKGNHDIFKLADYAPFFDDIEAYHKLGDLWLSHVPVHEGSLPRWARANVHGHLHQNRVLTKWDKIDARYFNVSVEHTDFRPILLEEVSRRIDEEQRVYGAERGTGHHM